MGKKRVIIGIIIIIVIIFLIIWSSKALGLMNNEDLQFSIGPCMKNLPDAEKASILGIKANNWLNESTLLVNIYISLNCIEKIKRGDFEKLDDRIILVYKVFNNAKIAILPNCDCVYGLNYTIYNIERKEYQFSIGQT